MEKDVMYLARSRWRKIGGRKKVLIVCNILKNKWSICPFT